MIFSLLSVFLAMAGIATLLLRRTFLGWVIGQQLLIQAVVSFGVFVGNSRGQPLEGQAAAFFMMALGVVFTASTLALATRKFYLKKTNQISEVKSL
jgi:NADH:ubiquinone oxidoreductase subunit K